MKEYLPVLIVISIVGAGLVTGLLFAFSNFVMKALADLPTEHGMFAMQRINKTILNPLFFVLFFGTPLLCALIALGTFKEIGELGPTLLCLGAITYLVGPFGITMLFNIPLNDRLAKATSNEAQREWPEYQRKWQRWNHIRSYVGILSVFLLATGLSRLTNC